MPILDLLYGEMISFIFIPIIFRGVYYILNGKTDKSYLYVLGTIGLILSHNISTLLTFILGFVYVLINIDKLKDLKILKTLLLSSFIIVLSVVFFEIPLLEQKSAVDLEVFRYGKMYSNTSVPGHALNPLQLLSKNADGPDSSMYFCLGLPILLGLLITPFAYKQNKKNKNYLYFLFTGLVTILMSTALFPWFFMPDIILMVQFPWRMLAIVTFSLSIISAINIYWLLNLVLKNIKNKKTFSIIENSIIAILIIVSTIYSLSFICNLDIKSIDNSYYEETEIIDPVNQVSKYSAFLEYWPQKSITSIDYVINRDNKVHIIDGNSTIQNENKTNGILDFDITNTTDNTSLELPYLFYKGYVVSYTPNNSNEKINLQTVESSNGLVQINIDSSISGHINVEYHATKLHKICIVISALTFILYLFYLMKNLFLNRKKQ